jgi:hypothetical protein
MSVNKSARSVIAVFLAATLVSSGLTLVSHPANAAQTKSITISGFSSNSSSLSKAMRLKMAKFVERNPSYKFATCVGFADKPGSASRNSKLGETRADKSCDQLSKLNPNLRVVATKGRWDDTRAGANIRRVRIILSVAESANLTTTFQANGAAMATPSTMVSKAGDAIVLPALTRPGFEFMGWHTAQFGGVKVGLAGESHVPVRNATLYAIWSQASSGSSSASPAPTGLSISSFSLSYNFVSNASSGDLNRLTSCTGISMILEVSVTASRSVTNTVPLDGDCTGDAQLSAPDAATFLIGDTPNVKVTLSGTTSRHPISPDANSTFAWQSQGTAGASPTLTANSSFELVGKIPKPIIIDFDPKIANSNWTRYFYLCLPAEQGRACNYGQTYQSTSGAPRLIEINPYLNSAQGTFSIGAKIGSDSPIKLGAGSGISCWVGRGTAGAAEPALFLGNDSTPTRGNNEWTGTGADRFFWINGCRSNGSVESPKFWIHSNP